jgi:hypothetical protein
METLKWIGAILLCAAISALIVWGYSLIGIEAGYYGKIDVY